MIVVDASALIAILDKEPDAALYAEAIAEADPPLISTATLLEVNISGQNCLPFLDHIDIRGSLFFGGEDSQLHAIAGAVNGAFRSQ